MAGAGTDGTPLRPLERVLETVLYVDDLDAAERFYGGILGLQRVSRRDGLFLFFRLRRQMLLLFLPEAAAENRALPPHGARGPGHVCFEIPEAELDGWRAHLERHGIAVEHLQHWPGGGRSLYFRDPAGNSVELAPARIWGLGEG